MINTKELYRILGETTVQLRKGAEVEQSVTGNLAVTEIYAMPATDDEGFADLEKVDLHFVNIGVDKDAASREKENLIKILNAWPNDELAAGPSYMAVGGTIGDQGAAFQLFALGKVLGLWDIITPESFGFSGDRARQMAGQGYIMITGYKGEKT